MNHIIECESENSLFEKKNTQKTSGLVSLLTHSEARLFRCVLLHWLFERELLINFMGIVDSVAGCAECSV